MKQSRLLFGHRPAVMLQLWNGAQDPYLAYVVFTPSASEPVAVGRLLVIELGMTIASTGLTSTAMYADRRWQ